MKAREAQPAVRPATDGERAGWLADRTERLTAAATRWVGDPTRGRAMAIDRMAAFAQVPAAGEARLLALEDAGQLAGFVAVSTEHAPDRGGLDEVWIAPDRRRQRLGAAGLAAGLAWLRERGCTTAVTTIDAADPASVALCRGWTLLSQRMFLQIEKAPEPLDGLKIRPMTEAEYGPWLRRSIDGYAASITESGSLDPATAREKSERDFAELLPDGMATQDHSLHVLETGGRTVSSLWLAHHLPGGRTFVYDIEVDTAERGRGYGRATMLAAERIAVDIGDTSIGLNVFGPNKVARGLYKSLGYVVGDQALGLRLTAAS